MWQWYLNATSTFEHAVSRGLGNLGAKVVRNPRKTLMIWALCLFGFLAGVLRFELVAAAEELWVDQNSNAMNNADFIDAFLTAKEGEGESVDGQLLLAVDKTKIGNNIMTYAHMEEYWQLHEIILTTKDKNGNTFDDLCVRDNPENECWYRGFPQFWLGNRTLYDEEVFDDASLQQALSATFYPDFTRVSRETWFPRLEEPVSALNFKTGFMVVLYLQQAEFKNNEQLSIDWMSSFVDTVISKNDEFTYLQLWGQASNSVDEELANSVGNDISLMIMAFTLMILFVSIVLGRPGSRLEGRTLLAQQAVGMVLLASAGGYGLAMLFGIPFTTLAQILPFILIGIGVDDALVITAAFDRTDRSKSIEDRVRETMEREGVSVTVTSLTDCVALLLGSTTKLPAVSYFCFYASLSILCIYLSFITAYIALLNFDELRRVANRSDPLPMCMGRAVNDDDFDYHSLKRKATLDDKLGSVLATKYAPLLLKVPVKVMVLVIFAAVTAMGMYGTTQITTQFELGDLVNDSSPIKRYLDLARTAYSGSPFPPVTAVLYTTDEFPMHTKAGTAEYLRLRTELLKDDSADEDRPVSFWLSDLVSWGVANGHASKFNAVDLTLTNDLTEPQYVNILEEFLNADFFGGSTYGTLYNESIYFTDDNLELTAVNIALRIDLVSTEEQARALRSLEKTIGESLYPNDVFIHHEAFMFWDQYAIIVREAVVTMLLATVAIGIISLFVLVHPLATLLLACTLGAILISVIGSLKLWNLDLNSISTVNLILSIGLVVDPISHMMHSFITQPHELSRNEKVTETMREIAPAVAQGIFSTVLGIMPLSLASSQVFRVFFQILFTTMILGAAFGLIFLPVVLSLVGPSVDRPTTRRDVLVVKA